MFVYLFIFISKLDIPSFCCHFLFDFRPHRSNWEDQGRERESAPVLVLLGRWRENEREMGAIKGDIVNGILTCMWLFSVGEGHWCG